MIVLGDNSTQLASWWRSGVIAVWSPGRHGDGHGHAPVRVVRWPGAGQPRWGAEPANRTVTWTAPWRFLFDTVTRKFKSRLTRNLKPQTAGLGRLSPAGTVTVSRLSQSLKPVGTRILLMGSVALSLLLSQELLLNLLFNYWATCCTATAQVFHDTRCKI